MNKKVVLFDLDNTLYDYSPAHKKGMEAVYVLFKKFHNISLKKFMRLFNFSRLETHQELSGTASSHNRTLYFQRLIEKTHNTIESKLVLRLEDAYWKAFFTKMVLRPGVIKTLQELKKKGLKIVIVSDLTTRIQLKKLIKLKINDYVDYLVTSEEAGSEKPHSIMFLLALNKIRSSPEEAMMVGDSKSNDVSGANAVGIDTVLITKEKHKFKKEAENYTKPDYIIKEIPELLPILDKMNSSK